VRLSHEITPLADTAPRREADAPVHPGTTRDVASVLSRLDACRSSLAPISPLPARPTDACTGAIVDSGPTLPILAAQARACTAQGQADACRRFQATLRATRERWEEEELSALERENAVDLGWHMRRVALSARHWARAAAGDEGATAALTQDFAAAQQALAARARGTEIAQTAGAKAFLDAASNFAAVVQRSSGRRSLGAADRDQAVKGANRLIEAFNALILG
jgi:hypothetical protein